MELISHYVGISFLVGHLMLTSLHDSNISYSLKVHTQSSPGS